MITCDGVTEGERNKQFMSLASAILSALSKAELSLLIKPVSSLWFWTYTLHTCRSCWTAHNRSVSFVFSNFVSLPCLFKPWIPEAGGCVPLGRPGGAIPAVCGQGSARCRSQCGCGTSCLRGCPGGVACTFPLSVLELRWLKRDWTIRSAQNDVSAFDV